MNASSIVRLIIALLAATLLMTVVPALQLTRAAGPWYVTPGGNDGNPCTSPGAPCATIDGAIGKAAAGDTIYVATGVYTGTSDQVVLLNKSATLTGGWDTAFLTQNAVSTLDAENARVGISLTIGITITVDRFIVQNANASGIYNNGTLTLTKSNVFSNTATNGGGIYNSEDGIVFLDHALIAGNRSISSGAGIENHGVMTVLSSTITNNIGEFMCVGGGISNLGVMTLSGGIVFSNTAYDAGGIQNSGTLLLTSSSVTNNTAGSVCGGLYNGGNVTVFSSTISGNVSHSSGGGIYNSGSLTVTNSTISGNSAVWGGGLKNYIGLASLNNATIAANIADVDHNGNGYGGGIDNSGPNNTGVVQLKNTIVGLNFDNSGQSPDCAGVATSQGYNLIKSTAGCTISGTTTGNRLGVDPLLGPLADNGGLTLTHLPLRGSPVINNGSNNGCPATDQRGIVRPQASACDIGAVEVVFPYSGYLPLISKPAQPLSGIYGKVTENGVPAANVRVALVFDDGTQWSTAAITYTQADGTYAFIGAPSLASGEGYAGVYFNYLDANRLGSWTTRQLRAYTAGSTIALGDFDIANIVALAPADGAAVGLPYTFQWQPRSATPSDSYAFRMLASTGSPAFMTDPPLGYVGSYNLNTLPAGFVVGTHYSWTIRAYAPDGGYGTSYGPRTITFTSSGRASGKH